MEELIKYLKQLDKEWLLCIIYELMQEGKFSFTELAELHVKHLEALKKGEAEKLVNLRSQVIDLWHSNKKDVGSKLTTLMQEAKDNGWANISQEQINKSKWNK